MMIDKSLEFFKNILETPSPSGYEQPVQKIVREYANGFADKIDSDSHGNVIAVKNPQAPLRVMYAGHCDQIGLIVQFIDENGFLYVQPIGGWDPQQLIGQRLTVWTAHGPVKGVIARKPIHLLTDEERKQVPKIKDLWLVIR
jgi:putative aminopeptidase FrvX